MEMKRTLALSAFLHVILFSAALMSFRGSRNMQPENMFFVTLTEDIKRPEAAAVVTKTEKPGHSFPLKEDKMKPLPDAYQKTVLDIHEKTALNTKQEPIKNVLSAADSFDSNQAVSGMAASDKNADDTNNKEVLNSTLSFEGPGNNEYQGSGHSLSGDKKISGKSEISPDAIIKLIENAIERAKAYPFWARKRGIEGTVYVSFRIGTDGKPEEITIRKSSGSGILDSATLDVVRKAAPYPFIESRVEIPVTYRLKD
jgi:TonB family protein